MGGGGERDGQAEPLLGKLSDSAYGSSEEQIVKRSGTAWTAAAHIITAVVGSGVLSLAWSVAQLGWVGGPVAMAVFAGVTVVQSSLLADCYISHDPERGVVRNRSYVDAVGFYLGEKSQWFCGFLLNFNLFGGGVVYTLTAAISMRAIQKANCYHREGHDAPCSAGGDGYYMLVFGLAQVVLSQIPGFHDMAWLSVSSAAMSFSYSLIGFGFGIAKVIANGVVKGGIGGIAMVSATQKAWRVSQAIGDIAYAYPYASVLLEIEDTLRPPENETMKTASRASVAVTTFFYLGCGCFGYAAFGDATPGNLLTGFGFYEPYWLVDFANLCIVLHLLGGYQVYSQPVFAVVERRMGGPAAGVVEVPLPVGSPPRRRRCRVNLYRLCFRTAYVAATTALAVWFPYFNQVVGLLGAFAFWPLSIHFPVEMYLVQKKVAPWTARWLAVRAFSAACFVTSAFASVGSAVGVFVSKTS
ncbi:probable amino acid permease 7 [Oryza brachyantha]|uniref:Amino acid transporter transmembrane domain-containing protein n=1 Tax=Oryza brachyantha TaxID=4533 RepID=J3LGK6_ORYBR|nr:probable amino acid permease 7 [Oryza brachyantha]